MNYVSADCLATMCRKVPLLMMECQVWIVTLLEQLIVINPAAATQVIFAVLPIVKVRQEVRDTLSMVLRKALYSSNTATRLMAVTGFLQLLKNFKMNSLGALSQSTSCNGSSTTSNASVHTQVDVEYSRPARRTQTKIFPFLISDQPRGSQKGGYQSANEYPSLFRSVGNSEEVFHPAGGGQDVPLRR